MAAKQADVYKRLNATFSAEELASMNTMVAVWRKDKLKAPDPYSDPTPAHSIADVRRELAKEEERSLSGRQRLVHEMSASAVIYRGLELEEQRYVDASLTFQES